MIINIVLFVNCIYSKDALHFVTAISVIASKYSATYNYALCA